MKKKWSNAAIELFCGIFPTGELKQTQQAKQIINTAELCASNMQADIVGVADLYCAIRIELVH